jgi:ferredoxin
MINLKIDNIEISAAEGTTILKAAESVGIHIPTMCYSEQVENHASCMVCMVKSVGSEALFPACETKVQESMNLLSEHPEVIEARKEAIELLLSDHVGDCEAPCRTSCPLYMDIPEMNRLIAKKDYKAALEIVKEEIALPIVLGYICHAPCEKACRRTDVDETLSICQLKRFVAEEDLKSAAYYQALKADKTGQSIAIVGAGLSGLSAAYHLTKLGYECVVYEQNSKSGGSLLSLEDNILPKQALASEIEILKAYGVDFQFEQTIDQNGIEEYLLTKHDAVILATGDAKLYQNTFSIKHEKVFVTGSAVKLVSKAVNAVAKGKDTAFSVHAVLSKTDKSKRPFNSKFGRLKAEELKEYLEEAPNKTGKVLNQFEPIPEATAIAEAERCMRCDCRKPKTCKLRICADSLNAKQKTYQFNERKLVRKYFHKALAVYEPEKCIRCGLCIKVTEAHNETYGLAFMGRGFNISIGIPFDKSLSEAMETTAIKCIEVCPTGAISHVDGEL